MNNKRKEKWTVEFEVEVADCTPAHYVMECHLTDGCVADLETNEDFCQDIMPSGIHRHCYQTCEVQLPWKLLKREEVP